jgi:hypothetical protein
MADNYKWGQLTWGDGNWGLQEPVTNGWGAYGWGESAWGENSIGITVLVTGQSLTSTLNSVTAIGTTNVSLTGQQLSTTLNSVSLKIDGDVTLTTNLANLTLNSVSALSEIIVPVTAPGTATTWGSNGWGQLGWGANVGLSTLQGNATVDIITVANVTGQLLSTSLNSVTVTGTASLTLTGQTLSAH